MTRLILPLAVLLAIPAAGVAGPAEAASSRGRTIGGARVDYVSEGDGGRMVRVSRRGRGYWFEYHLGFWHGNGGVFTGATFRRGDCRNGDADMLRPAEDALARSSLDQWLADYLRACPLSPVREAELRRSLDSAWPLFEQWAREAAALTEAEAEAIARYGAEP